MSYSSLLLPVTLIATLLVGCAAEEEDPTNDPLARLAELDRNRHGDQDCFHLEFTVETQTAAREHGEDVLLYTATSGPANNQERMTLDFYFTQGATDGAQLYDFEIEDPSVCHTCLQIRRGCSDADCSDGQIFIPVDGTLVLDDMDPAGGLFAGEISSTLLGEVTIDADTNLATAVENGETWCIEAHVFDLVVE